MDSSSSSSSSSSSTTTTTTTTTTTSSSSSSSQTTKRYFLPRDRSQFFCIWTIGGALISCKYKKTVGYQPNACLDILQSILKVQYISIKYTLKSQNCALVLKYYFEDMLMHIVRHMTSVTLQFVGHFV